MVAGVYSTSQDLTSEDVFLHRITKREMMCILLHWKPDDLKRIFDFRKIISNREKCRHLVSSDYPIIIDKEQSHADHWEIEGHFLSPLTTYLPGIMPKEVEIARFQGIFPKRWKSNHKPVCIHLAGTGDHYFWRRRKLMALPLLKEAGIASIILENPYYGTRKPKAQIRSSLHNVSDLFVMGGALVVESLALLHWCEKQGYGPLGLTGISMGGHMASLASTNWHKPHCLIPCLSWSTASPTFTRGVLSGAIPWSLLEQQYLGDRVYQDQIKKLIISPEDVLNGGAFQLGKEFVHCFPETARELEKFRGLYEPDSQAYANVNLSHTVSDTAKLNTTLGLDIRATSSQGSSSNISVQYPQQKQPTQGKMNLSIREHNIHNINTQRSPLQGQKSKKQMHLKSKRDLRMEALDFMRGVMDECTHLGNFSVPVDPSLIIIVAAKRDAYIPRDNVMSLTELWPGSEVRHIEGGHIQAFLLNQVHFRKAIIDAFDKQIKKYHS